MDSKAVEPADLSGLSKAQVAARVAAGQSNVDTDVKTKTITQILAEHTFTFFNGINVFIALLVVLTGQYRNMLFFGTVVVNLAIGIAQELRAKAQVDRLQVLTAADVRVRREGTQLRIPVSQVVLGDIVLLAHGEQVPADMEVLEGVASMNEGLLTGEAAPVEKYPGDELLSGSFVDSGSVVARVVRVGKEGYAARINAEAKFVKAVHSEIKDTIETIVRLGTYILIPLGSLLFLRTFQSGSSWDSAILTSVSAVIAMIPQGLVVLTSTVLAIATTRLAMQQVLVQQIYCVETLARVDVLCLDKTGTITTGRMVVDELCSLTGQRVGSARAGGAPPDEGSPAYESPVWQALLATSTIAHATQSDANETARAILTYMNAREVPYEQVAQTVPFSSLRKYSGCVTTKGHAYVMGAGQFLLGKRFSEVEPQIRSFGELSRVLVVAEVDGFGPQDSLAGEVRVLGFISLRDEIRDSAAETMRYFISQGVGLRVISGDDPVTVSGIAALVGVPDADHYVDASTLDTDQKIQKAVRECRVFGRVTPDVKRGLVRALKDQGHTVAMTGDGVNDILALREADCSIAMASGSAAARNVAEIVLADNDFAHMPEVVAEGRRSINNLQRSASLFLVKTVYAAVLAFFCVFLPPYPFVPVQASLLSGVIIGYPSFVLALVPNHDLVEGSFLEHVLSKSLPASLAIVVALFTEILAGRAVGWSFDLVSTSCTYLVAVVSIALVWRVSTTQPLLQRILVISMSASMVFAAYFLSEFFKIADLTGAGYVFCIVVGAIAIGVFLYGYDWSCASANGEGLLHTFISRVGAINAKREEKRAERRTTRRARGGEE